MSGNPKNESNSGFADVCSVLCDIDDPDRMRRFLGEIMTPSERRDLGLRWELMRQLKAGVPQRHIAKQLHISLCKITRGAKILKTPHSVCNHYLNTGDEDEPKDSAG